MMGSEYYCYQGGGVERWGWVKEEGVSSTMLSWYPKCCR